MSSSASNASVGVSGPRSSGQPSASSEDEIPLKPSGSTDIGWNYGKLVKKNSYNEVKCNKCHKIVKGGIYRFKQHVAGIGGDVKACVMQTDEDRKIVREFLSGPQKKKVEKKRAENELREEVLISAERESMDPELIGEKRPRVVGPLNRIVASEKWKQTSINEAEKRKFKELAHDHCAMWAYAKGITFNAFDDEEFDLFCECVGHHGPGYKGPSQYQFRVPLLNKAYKKIDEEMDKTKKLWDEYGCSILTDGWTDRKHRSVMNLCVHCKTGTHFLKSIEDSANAHTGEYIFNWVEKCIQEVGENRVLQVVTDNHSSNMAAKNILKISRPNIFWSSCAAHTIDLMLEAIGKLPKYKLVIEKARSLTVFLYAHHSTLALMREFTNRRDLVRPGITRFATTFLSLSCLVDKKSQLAAMVSSTKWDDNRWSKTEKGRVTKATIYSDIFWTNARELLKMYTPLFKLLRIVDADRRPSMGFVYGMLEDAKNEVQAACNRKETTYRPIIDIIEKESRGRLDSALHLAAYYLNPYYYYRDRAIQDNSRVITALMSCISVFYQDEDIQDKIGSSEVLSYKMKEGLMGSGMAERYHKGFNGADNFDPAHWWSFYGGDVPYLRKMTIKILSLTSSSSGCERNFSVFEGIHTKKRNRLDSKRLNDLVFVQFNKKMTRRRTAKKRNSQEYKDVLVGEDDSRALHWKSTLVRERENNEEEEIFPGSGLTLDLVAAASGANEDHIRRSNRIAGRRVAEGRSAQEGSSSATLDDISEDNSDENLREDGGVDIEDFVDSSEESDPDLHYEDDEEDE